MSTNIALSKETPVVRKRSYPRLVKSRFTESLVVWALSETDEPDGFQGVVLQSDNSYYSVGELNDCLAVSSFIDFNGTASLTNKD